MRSSTRWRNRYTVLEPDSLVYASLIAVAIACSKFLALEGSASSFLYISSNSSS